MHLSSRLIDAFLALTEARRFSVAAQRCHVSAPAFSQMISRLETIVGARLFDRDTRNVSLTPEGQLFLVGARRITNEMRASLSELQDYASLKSGRVSVAAPPSLCSSFLPKLLAAFQEDHPNIQVRLHDVVSNRCLSLVSSGDVDFGLNAQPGSELEFINTHLFDDSFYFICREDHPLASRSFIRMSDLKGQSFIHTTREGSVWQQMQTLLVSAKVTDSGFEVSQFGTLAGLIEAGFGISIVPANALSLCLRSGLVAKQIRSIRAQRPIYAVCRRGRNLSMAALSLWDRVLLEVQKTQNTDGF